MSLSQGSGCLSCQHGHDVGMLLPHLAGAVVQRAEVAGTLPCIRASPQTDATACPSCGRASRRMHSQYERRLADAAIGDRRVLIRLQVRRLRPPAMSRISGRSARVRLPGSGDDAG